MNPLTFQEIEEAAETIVGERIETRIATSERLDEALQATVFCKVEAEQRAGSFKFRGAYNRLARIPDDDRRAGVVAVSSGNHGAAVSLAARILDMPAVIFIPEDAPGAKRALIEEFGAEIITFNRTTEDRESLASARVESTGATFVHPFEDRYVMAGQGTAALELHRQVGPLDQLFVPLSGGGLMAGSATAMNALDPGCDPIGVEPELGDDTRRSFEAGHPVQIDQPKTIADGLAVTRPGDNTFAINHKLVREVRTVAEAQIAEAMALIERTLGLVVEPSGAVGIAALMVEALRSAEKATESGDLPTAAGRRRVGVILSGGNVDRELFERLTAEYRSGRASA